jgi:hypothetical protein
MAEKELILNLGVEGGGATIYRSPDGPGSWQFHVEGSSMFLDENDDEGWKSWTTQPVRALEEALRSVAQDGSWILFHPSSIHPEYRAVIWEQVRELARKLPKQSSRRWEHQRPEWQRLCLGESKFLYGPLRGPISLAVRGESGKISR